MEINGKCMLTLFAILLLSCATANFDSRNISALKIIDFGSDNMERCRPTDVDLDDQEVREYFSRAAQVDLRVIHDNYNYAPCYIEGTLKYNNQNCEWEIRAGATGHIRCYKDVKYFVCDTCQDLFE